MVAPSKSRHFIREWRKYRGLTLEQVAAQIGMSHQNLGKIERGLVPYNQGLLEALAENLRCEPAELIIRAPLDTEVLWLIMNQLSPLQREQVTEIARTIQRTGANG